MKILSFLPILTYADSIDDLNLDGMITTGLDDSIATNIIDLGDINSPTKTEGSPDVPPTDNSPALEDNPLLENVTLLDDPTLTFAGAEGDKDLSSYYQPDEWIPAEHFEPGVVDGNDVSMFNAEPIDLESLYAKEEEWLKLHLSDDHFEFDEWDSEWEDEPMVSAQGVQEEILGNKIGKRQLLRGSK